MIISPFARFHPELNEHFGRRPFAHFQSTFFQKTFARSLSIWLILVSSQRLTAFAVLDSSPSSSSFSIVSPASFRGIEWQGTGCERSSEPTKSISWHSVHGWARYG